MAGKHCLSIISLNCIIIHVFYVMKFRKFLQKADVNYTTTNTFYLLCVWHILENISHW